jgi:DedD protein
LINPTVTDTAATDPAPTDTLPDQTYASVDTDSAAAKPVTTTAATNPAVTEAKPVAEKVVVPPKPLTEAAWVVKVGSFGKEQNANALVGKLRQAGFATFSRKITNGQGQTMISVLVGPDLKKEQLERSLPQLQQLAAVKNLKVMAFSPVENN